MFPSQVVQIFPNVYQNGVNLIEQDPTTTTCRTYQEIQEHVTCTKMCCKRECILIIFVRKGCTKPVGDPPDGLGFLFQNYFFDVS